MVFIISREWIQALRTTISSYKLTIIAFILFLPLTILLTYPVAFRIGTDIPGLPADQLQWMRILWYTKISLLNPDITTLTHDNLLFYPHGITTMPFVSAFNQLLYLALSPFFDLPVIYTLLWLLTFYLSACGAFLLVKYLTENYYAAFISGILFAFSCYHFSRGLYFFGATTIQWIPFCALYLMKMYKEGKMRNSVIAGFFFILVAMSDLQNMVFMGIFVLLLFIYEWYGIPHAVSLRNLPIKEIFNVHLKKYIIFFTIAVCGILPLVFYDIRIAVSNENFLKPMAGELTLLSNDLASFFVPSHMNPVLGSYFLGFYARIPSWFPERVNYIGYTVLALTAFVLLTMRRDNFVKFWLLTAGLFSIFSLGPLLRIMGESVFTVFKTTIPLPYIFMYYTIPFLDNCRTVGRFFVIATLAFSVLSGYGIASLLQKKERKRGVLVTAISILLVFSCLNIPYPTTAVSIPKFYTDISHDTDHYALLELPSTINGGKLGFNSIYFQTIHGKAIVGGYSARYPSGVHNFQKNTPFIRDVTYLNSSPDIIQQPLERIGTSLLTYYNIRYIVIHTDEMSAEALALTTNLIDSTMESVPVVYENDSLVVYRVPSGPMTSFLTLGEGWYDVEGWNKTPTRWMSENATLLFYSDRDRAGVLSLNATSYQHSRTLEIYLGDALIFEKVINPYEFVNLSIPLPAKQGMNTILFHVEEGCDRPSEKKESDDSRCLSLAVQHISFVGLHPIQGNEID